MAIADRWVLVSAGSSFRSLVLYDVSDPTAPWPAVPVPNVPQAEPVAVAIADGLASVAYRTAAAPGGLLVLYRVGGAVAILEVGRVEVAGTKSVARFGSMAAVAGSGGIDIVDLSDPEAPAVVAHVPVAAEDVAVAAGGLAARQVTGDSKSRLLTFDVSDPTDPRPLGETGVLDDVHSLVISGGFAYLARSRREAGAWTGDTVVVDLTDPSQPTVAGALETGAARDVAVRDGMVVTAARERGATASRLAVSTGLAGPPSRLSGRRFMGVAVDGRRLAAPAIGDGIWLLEWRHGVGPVEVGMWPRDGSTVPFAASDGLLWVFNGDRFVVVDALDPADPVVLEELIAPPTGVALVAASGRVAAVASIGESVIRLVDARDPAAVTWSGALDPGGAGGSVWRLSMDGTSLVVSYDHEVVVADVSDPWTPVVTATFMPGELDPVASDYDVWDVAADGGRAWVVMGRHVGYWSDLAGALVDVSDPTAAAPAGGFPPTGATVAVAGPVYASASPSYPPADWLDVALADLRRPSVVVHGFGGSAFLDAAATDGRRVFASTGNRSTLDVLDFSCTELFDLLTDGFESGDAGAWTACGPRIATARLGAP